MRNLIEKTLLILFLTSYSHEGWGQETAARFSEGSVIIGFDSSACTAGIDGSIRYNSNSGTDGRLEICNGSDWKMISCAPPSDCSTPGDTCTDGSIFAGYARYGTSCRPLFADDINQSGYNDWRTSNAFTGTENYEDGRENQAFIVANETLSDYPAFELCENLSRHGHTDWYLPAVDEASVLYRNRAAIGNFTSENYWTSTETASSFGHYLHFNSGIMARQAKTTNYRVRCVRRD